MGDREEGTVEPTVLLFYVDEGTPVLWKRRPYLAVPDDDAQGEFVYLTSVDGARHHVPVTELEDVNELVAVVRWSHAESEFAAAKTKRKQQSWPPQ